MKTFAPGVAFGFSLICFLSFLGSPFFGHETAMTQSFADLASVYVDEPTLISDILGSEILDRDRNFKFTCDALSDSVTN